MRLLFRAEASGDTRVLLISDSMVAIGCLAKGRSPSWALLRLARMSAAVVLTCGLNPYYRSVESKRNHADGPSRGLPVGVAPEWATEKEKEFLTRTARAAKRTNSAPAEVGRTAANPEAFLTAG